MRIGVALFALALVTAPAGAQEGSHAGGAPPAIASAGVTQSEWAAVRAEVARQARRVRVSEASLLSAAEAVGSSLARSGNFNASQLQQAIFERLAAQADQIAELQARLERLRGDADPSIAIAYTNARTALEAGRLGDADRLLADVAERDLAAIQQADAEVERRRLRAGDTVAARGQVAYLRADYLAASDFMARAASIVPQSAIEVRWSYVSLQADALRQRGELFSETDRLREAVRIFRNDALPLAPRALRPNDWAKTQVGLGIALDVLGAHDDPDATRQSVAAHRAALSVYAEARSPQEWAGAQINLGAALNTLGERGDEQALRDAVSAFRAALRVSTRQSDPTAWAMLQTNLSISYRALGLAGDSQAFQEAVAASRAALEVDTRARDPNAWAKDQVNLGNALSSLGERGDERALVESIRAYRSALEVTTRERDPSGWAATQVNLANVLYLQGRSGDVRVLYEALTALDGALGVFTRENAPAYWAAAQNNRGQALFALGARSDGHGSGLDALRQAVEAHRAALTVDTRESAPAFWARDQVNLGDALNAIGRLRNSVSDLRAAVSAYTEALSERTRERDSEAWAQARANRGIAYMRLDNQGVEGALGAAIGDYRAALEVLTLSRNSEVWGETQYNLGTVLAKQADRGDRARYRDAEIAYRSALQAFGQNVNPERWADTQASLGGVLQMQGKLEEAVTALNAALQVRTPETDADGWALVQIHLGDLQLARSSRDNPRALEEAIVAYRAALRVWTRERDGAQWGVAQGNLGNALASLYFAGGDVAALQEAVLAFRRALSVVSRENNLDAWSTRQYNLATTLYALVQSGERQRLPEAVTAARAALDGFREQGDERWAGEAQRLVNDLNAMQ